MVYPITTTRRDKMKFQNIKTNKTKHLSVPDSSMIIIFHVIQRCKASTRFDVSITVLQLHCNVLAFLLELDRFIEIHGHLVDVCNIVVESPHAPFVVGLGADLKRSVVAFESLP